MRPFSIWWFAAPITIFLLCISALAYHWTSINSEYLPWEPHNTRNPSYFYWPLAQALRELEVAKSDLISVADGSPVDADGFSFHTDLLISSVGILVRNSELNRGYMAFPDFAESQPFFSDFAKRLLPGMAVTMARSDAQALLPTFDKAYDILLKLSEEAWLQDNRVKEQSLEAIRTGNLIIFLNAGLLVLLAGLLVLLMTSYWRALYGKMRAVNAAEAAIADKVNFLAMVSHELRTPLQTIISSLDLLERSQASLVQHELRTRIRRAANSLAIQLRDMLTLARAKTGYIELRPAVFDVVTLVHEVLEHYEDAAIAKGLRLSKICPEGAVFVVADGERIGQVLHNLVSNAVKYTSNGYVVLELSPFRKASNELTFRLTDSGPGLPSRTFTSDVDSSGISSLGSVRGIGLSVVQTLLAHLGATMKVGESNEGGASFQVSVPVVEAPERTSRASEISRILVVDDQPELLAGFAEVLHETGSVVDVTTSGMAALNFLAAHQYDVVFIDIEMPIMAGPELAAQIRKTSHGRVPRLVAITASDGHVQNLINFDAILRKPIRQKQLMHAMRL